MPRIRTLKPEHRQHRKVGPLTDREYRLWVSMILEADDEGRLVCTPAQLRACTWPYLEDSRRCTTDAVEMCLRRIATLGLIVLYDVQGVRYAAFPSWGDHQVINKKKPSRLPPPPNPDSPVAVPEQSRTDTGGVPGEGKGIERKGKEVEGKGGESEGREHRRIVDPVDTSNGRKPAKGEYQAMVNHLKTADPSMTDEVAESIALAHYHNRIHKP